MTTPGGVEAEAMLQAQQEAQLNTQKGHIANLLPRREISITARVLRESPVPLRYAQILGGVMAKENTDKLDGIGAPYRITDPVLRGALSIMEDVGAATVTGEGLERWSLTRVGIEVVDLFSTPKAEKK